jgi:hypothetical protein
MANPISRLAALALLLTAPLFAQIRSLPPVDESGRDPALVEYLTKLKAAVAKQDRDALVALVDPNIKNGFGGEDGLAYFTPEWALLQRLLDMGGAWSGDSFSIPYVFAKFPEDLDAFEYAAITGQGVRLRQDPSTSSRIRALMYYDLVKVEEQGEDWWKIVTLNGEPGYVSARYIASPVSYRAIFQKDDSGDWKMRAMLAGD